jgi:hypothetical protein
MGRPRSESITGTSKPIICPTSLISSEILQASFLKNPTTRNFYLLLPIVVLMTRSILTES